MEFFLADLTLPQPPSLSPLALSLANSGLGKVSQPVIRKRQLSITVDSDRDCDHVLPLWADHPHHHHVSHQPKSWLLTKHILYISSGQTFRPRCLLSVNVLVYTAALTSPALLRGHKDTIRWFMPSPWHTEDGGCSTSANPSSLLPLMMSCAKTGLLLYKV